jgi:Bacterial pre-peptidase C-terminal domain
MRRFFGFLLFFILRVSAGVNAQEDDPLSFGSTMTGRIDNANPSAVFYFDGLRGEVIAINLQVTGGDLDPVLTVVNNQGEEIMSLDDGSCSRVPTIPALRIPRSDRYYVTVGRFGYALGTTAGGFELDIQRVGVSSASGSMLRFGDQVINSISDMNPQLYYSFRAQRGDIVNIRMRRVSGDLDPYLQVVNSETFVIADNDDMLGATIPFDAGIEGLVIEKDGLYVIIASRYGQAAGRSEGNFVLIIEEAANSGMGNSVQTALTLQVGESIDGKLTEDQFANYYRFEARANDLITVRMSRATGNLDSFLVLSNAGVQELIFDDDGGGGQNAEIRQYIMPADGIYYIIATRLDREAGITVGSYRLELQNLGNAFDGVPEGLQRIGFGSTVTGNIDDTTPEVVYAFWGVEGEIVTVSMNRGDGDLDPVVSILNSDQRAVVSDDDSGSGQDARIERYVIPVTGTYYVRATRYSGEPPGNPNTRGSFILVLARRFN